MIQEKFSQFNKNGDSPPKGKCPPGSCCASNRQRTVPPQVFGSTWCKPFLLLEPMWQSDPRRRARRQVIFHVSPRPGQTPTSSQALCNHLLPHFQPKPHLSLTLCPLRKWGSVSPNLPSALPRECLISFTHTHTHTAPFTEQKTKQNRATAKGQRSAQIKGNLLCRLCISTVSLSMPVSNNEKKIQKAILPATGTCPRVSPHSSGGQCGRCESAQGRAGGAGPRGRPGRTHGPSSALTAGSPRRKLQDVGTVPGREKAQALARLS